MLNFRTLVAASALVLLAACGGGGGKAGTPTYGTTTTTGGVVSAAGVPAVISVSLVDASNNVISPPVVTGSTDFSVRAVVLDSSGKGVESRTISLAASDLTLTPTSGQKISGADGSAQFAAKQTNAALTSTTSVCASVLKTSGGSDTITTCIDVQLGAVSATLGTLTASPATLQAYQSASVSVPLTIGSSTVPYVGAPVTFNASCGTVSPTTAVTNSSGIATVSYVNSVTSGATTSSCSGTVTITANTQGSTKTASISTASPAAANIQFVAASPQRIYLAGSPGLSSSQVSFKLVDSSGNPIPTQTLTLSLQSPPTGVYLGATPGTSSLSVTAGGDGIVTTSVNAGSAPGPVQIKAEYTNGTTKLTNVSNALSVASGRPSQQAFSLSVSTLNIEAAQTDGVKTTLTVRAADRLGNPVPDGTTINFIAEGGQVAAECKTSGASTNETSACSVSLSSQNPRPTNNRITVLAWAQGEESFVDNSVPSNNVFDLGTDTFTDLGQPFRDDNFNEIFDLGEPTVGTSPPGTATCLTPSNLTTKPNSCDGSWGAALVSATTEIVFSEDTFDVSKLALSALSVSGSPSNRCSLSFVLKDVNGNPLPAGTKLSAIPSGGKVGGDAVVDGFGGEGDTVPNTSKTSRTTHSVIFKDCTAPASLTFRVNVLTPSGKTTSFFYPPIP